MNTVRILEVLLLQAQHIKLMCDELDVLAGGRYKELESKVNKACFAFTLMTLKLARLTPPLRKARVLAMNNVRHKWVWCLNSTQPKPKLPEQYRQADQFWVRLKSALEVRWSSHMRRHRVAYYKRTGNRWQEETAMAFQVRAIDCHPKGIVVDKHQHMPWGDVMEALSTLLLIELANNEVK